MVVLLEYRVALGFAHLLEDDLLGHLRGDAPQHIGRLVVANFAAYLNFRRQFARLVKSDLVHRIFNLVRHLDHCLVHIRADFAAFLIQLGAHIFLRLVVLARRQRDRVFHRGHNHVRVNALVTA